LKKHLVRIALGLAIGLVFLGHAARFYEIGLLNQLDYILYDTRLQLTMPNTVDNRVVILDIDEKSLAELGHWPWKRDLLGSLITKLFDKYNVALVGFDIFFAERDESSGIKSLDRMSKEELKDNSAFQGAYRELRPKLDYDQIFADALKGRPVVMGFVFSNDEGAKEIGVLPEAVLPAGTFRGRPIPFLNFRGFIGNLPELQKSAASGGHVNMVPDDDGIVRRVPMVVEFKGAYYESLSLAMLRALVALDTGALPNVVPGYAEEKYGIASRGYQGLEWLDLPTTKGRVVRIPVDSTVSTLVPYRGDRNSFKYISLADVAAERVDPAELKGKIALVGTSAQGLLDLRATPVNKIYPGVEVHANMIAGMIDGSLKQRPPYVLGAEFVLVLLTGAVMAMLLPLLNPLKATLTTLLVLLFVLVTNLLVWHYGNLVLPLASSVMLIVALFALNMSYGYFVESRSKRQFTELFGQYVPPELVDKMSENPEGYSMAGKKGDLTVLFSDVRGFTTISESLQPEELERLMNEYFNPMTEVIRNQTQGTLDKYIGDAIMAFWGAPVEQPDHAKRAVRAAMEMQRVLAELRPGFKEKYHHDIFIGVGLSSGSMTVGDMGSEVRKAYTVMGDKVNLGARLEGLTKQYGVGILVAEETRSAVLDVVFREIDRVRVKGKDEPVVIFEPVGAEGKVSKAELDELKLWNQVIKLYRSQDWDQAELQLFNLKKLAPDRFLYDLYAKRIAEYRSNPPGQGWDGVTTFETK
jgi:adenylate cyclase